MKFIFRDSKNFEVIDDTEYFVIRDYFTNKIIHKFSIPGTWSFAGIEN